MFHTTSKRLNILQCSEKVGTSVLVAVSHNNCLQGAVNLNYCVRIAACSASKMSDSEMGSAFLIERASWLLFTIHFFALTPT